MRKLAEKVKRSIQSRVLLPRGAKVLVAVSGGVDSVVLLHLLHRLAGEFGWELAVAHFNHQLRGRSSDADERFVRELAARLQVRFHVARADVKAHARATGHSIEMSARELRHRFFAKTAGQIRAQAVALAHHADDQVELFFLRVLRGASGRGLGGMKWSSPSPANFRVRLVRPLLDLTRAEIERFASEQGIAFRQDATNSRREFLRNRIRHELLPRLRRRFQSGVDRTVARLMEILGDDAEAVEAFARDWLKRRRPTFGKLAPAVQRSVLELQLHEHGVPPDFERLEALRLSARRAVTVSPGRQVVRGVDGSVTVQRVRRAVFNRGESRCQLGGRAGELTFGGVEVRWKIDTARAGRRPIRQEGREVFDADRIGTQIVLRHWKPGDRFRPIGMSAAVKLQDWFTNQRVPREQRHALVIATTRVGVIFWIQGQRIGDDFKLTAATTRRLHWHWSCG